MWVQLLQGVPLTNNMCLDINYKKVEPTNKEKWVWKVFRLGVVDPKQLFGTVVHTKFRRGVWLTARYTSANYYGGGFHAYTTQEAKRKASNDLRIVLRVKVKGIVVRGKQNGYRAVVAKQLFIPKQTVGFVYKCQDSARRGYVNPAVKF